MNDASGPRDHSIAGTRRPDGHIDRTPIDDWLGVLASWFERHLDGAVGWDRSSRLYGITVIDAEQVLLGTAEGARAAFLATGWVYDLLDSPSARLAMRYDALGLCCFGRATNLDTKVRSRCRTVVVADASGLSSVNRLKGAPPEVTGRPSGPVAERLRALFGSRQEPEGPQPA